MAGLQLVEEHLPGNRAMCSQAAKPGHQQLLQALLGAEGRQVTASAAGQHGLIGTVEPGFHQVVLLRVVLGDGVEADAEFLGHLEQVQPFPTAGIGEVQGAIEYLLGAGGPGHGLTSASQYGQACASDRQIGRVEAGRKGPLPTHGLIVGRVDRALSIHHRCSAGGPGGQSGCSLA
ncbi:hypothetical protein D3C81_1709340 [compost metagenome]